MSTLRISNIEAKADNSSPTVDEQLKFTNSTGDLMLYLDGRTSGITTVGINTTNQTIKFDANNNVMITGIVTATEFHGTLAVGTSVTYGDNEKAYFGNGLDLQIYHNSGINYIDAAAGHFALRGTGNDNILYYTANGDVEIYDNGNKKIETTNTGAVVTGILTATSFSGGLPITNGADNRVITASSASAIQGEANLTWDGNKLHGTATGEIARFQSTNSAAAIRLYSTGAHYTEIGHTGDTYIAVGNAERLRITSAGKVGVGTDGPSQQFTSYADSGYPILANSSSNGIGLGGNGAIVFGTKNLGSYAPGILDASTLEIKISGNPKFNINSSGNIGINQTNPTVKLQITDTSATILRTEATANDGDALIQAKGKDSSGNDRMIQMRTDAGADQYRIISSDTSYNLALCTGNAPRLLIAGNSAATSIGGANAFNAMLTTQGDISGGLFMIKASENTNRLFVTGNDTSGCEVNLYDEAGGQRGILGVSGTEFFIKAPNTNAPLTFYTHNGTSLAQRMVLKSDGKVGMQIADPKSNLHVYGPGEIRLGGQYGGHASIMEQVEYSSGYTGVHWMFETNNQMSWSFDGVMIVHGAGGSSYGTEVTHIKIVYSRENGALNSGDTWRNGSSDYNIETLGHAQVGLNPSAGSLSYTEQTDPDGAGSTRSLFKLSWSASGQGVGVWSKLIGNFYWGAASSSGSVEIQDKDGNIKFNSNP